MKKIFLISFFVLALSGCDFFSDEKKVINIQDNNLPEREVEKKEEIKIDQKTENVLEEKKEEEVSVLNEEKKDATSEQISEKKSANSDIKIVDKLVSWGFGKANGRKIDTIIIHSSYNAVGKDKHDLDDIIYKEYKPYGVSPHYIISREGKIFRLVSDKNIAYHAGVSSVPDGRKNVNEFSIGIEIVNTASEKPNDKQYDALRDLIEYLKEKYEIKYVLGHSEIAPGRKDDPWNFEYGRIRRIIY